MADCNAVINEEFAVNKGLVQALALLLCLLLTACANPADDEKSVVRKAAPAAVTLPPTTTGLTARSGNGEIVLQWTPIPSASTYTLYIGHSPGFALESADRLTGITRPDHLHRPIEMGSTWYYRVAAVNDAGEGPASVELAAMNKGTPPAMPTGVTATGSATDIALHWNAVAGATSYVVFCSSLPGQIAATRGEKFVTTRLEYQVTDLPSGRIHYFAVAAVNNWGKSPHSAEVGAMSQAPRPPPPSGVAASGGDGVVTVKWEEVPGATTYNVYVSTVSGQVRKTGQMIAGITQPFYRQKKISGQTMHYYVVTAVNHAGEGRPSNESGAMP